MPNHQSPWLVCSPQLSQAKIRLFCFPHAGGGASVFRSWRQLVPSVIEIVMVQYPGREQRLAEKPVGAMSELIDAFIPALDGWLDKPFCFFGHSMGALVAFEAARELNMRGLAAPAHFFVSACPAPHLRRLTEVSYTLPDEALIAKLRRLEGAPLEVYEQQEMMRLVLPTIRADFKICETYAYQQQQPLSCPISAAVGIRDPDVSQENMRAWEQHTTSQFILRMFQGGHFFLNEQRVPLLSAICQDILSMPH